MKKNNALITAVLSAGLGAGAALWLTKRKNAESAWGQMPAPQMGLEKELAKRLPDMIYYDRFQLVIQPVVDLKSGGIVGGEVLSRLNHPEQGIIFPNEFLPCVEETGLFPRFDLYIFGKACQLMQQLTQKGVKLPYLSCNFSRLTLSEKDAAARITRIADEHGIPRERLAVEITEQEPEKDTGIFCQNLRQIKDAGFRIFVDDLGAGVTSVRDLWSYPVDVVKIDRSLLLDTDNDQGRCAYRGLSNLAGDLGYKVLCEGVETEEQHRFVLEAGCDYGQGFLFHRPMDPEQFLHLMVG